MMALTMPIMASGVQASVLRGEGAKVGAGGVDVEVDIVMFFVVSGVDLWRAFGLYPVRGFVVYCSPLRR